MPNPRRRRATRPADAPTRAIGYLRVSTDEQVESGAGLDVQRARLIDRAAREGWTVCLTADEGLSAKNMDRPALLEALDSLDRGEADVLVAAKLDRISRSTADFAKLLDRSRNEGWRLVIDDLGVDTSTDAGRFVARTIANAAEYERDLISSRTRDGMAAKRAAGVRLGRPSSIPREVVARIVAARDAGTSMGGIAAMLTEEGVPTVSGRPVWSKATVQSVLAGQDAAAVRLD
jgi:DNA invertase Pin-like site-specific DNA recombinase